MRKVVSWHIEEQDDQLIDVEEVETPARGMKMSGDFCNKKWVNG